MYCSSVYERSAKISDPVGVSAIISCRGLNLGLNGTGPRSGSLINPPAIRIIGVEVRVYCWCGRPLATTHAINASTVGVLTVGAIIAR